MPRITKAAKTAARISTPCPRKESWNTCAVPEKPVAMVAGRFELCSIAVPRFQRDEQPAVIGGHVGTACADRAVDILHRRVAAQNIGQVLLAYRHRLERGIGRS